MTLTFCLVCIQSKSHLQSESNIQPPRKETPQHHVREAINPRTGRRERVFVNLEAVYPDYKNPTHEVCFEELRAASRGWLQKDWSKSKKALKEIHANTAGRLPSDFEEATDRLLAQDVKHRLVLGESSQDDYRDSRSSKVKKIKMKEREVSKVIRSDQEYTLPLANY